MVKRVDCNIQTSNDTWVLSSPPTDSLLFEARLNDEIGLSFNPQPSAQANRRPADFFKRCGAMTAHGKASGLQHSNEQ